MAPTESRAPHRIWFGLGIVLVVAVGLGVACRSEPRVRLSARTAMPPVALPAAAAPAPMPTELPTASADWVRKPKSQNMEEEKAMENPATVILAGLMVLALIIGVAAILAVIGAGGVGLLGGTLYLFRRLTGRDRDDAAVSGVAPRSDGR